MVKQTASSQKESVVVYRKTRYSGYMDTEERISKLTARKRGFERNRNLCLIVLALLSWNVWTAHNEDSPPWYFYLIMGAIIATVIGVGIYGHLTAQKIAAEIEEAQEELQEANPDSAGDTESGEEDGDEVPLTEDAATDREPSDTEFDTDR